MTNEHTHPKAISDDTPSSTTAHDHMELQRFLADYHPRDVAPQIWALISNDAAELVLRAGRPRRQRVANDIVVVAQIVAHLVERGRPVTLDEVLADSTLLSFDTAAHTAPGTRERMRGIHRRLQATHRGLPWRAERRPDGNRIANLTPHTTLASLHCVSDAAQAAEAGDHEAQAFLSALEAARSQRLANRTVGASVDEATWTRARRYAEGQGLPLTKPTLRALVTQEVIDLVEPVAVLAARFALTRRDLDLALTRIADLPPTTSPEIRDLLRGS